MTTRVSQARIALQSLELLLLSRLRSRLLQLRNCSHLLAGQVLRNAPFELRSSAPHRRPPPRPTAAGRPSLRKALKQRQERFLEFWHLGKVSFPARGGVLAIALPAPSCLLAGYCQRRQCGCGSCPLELGVL